LLLVILSVSSEYAPGYSVGQFGTGDSKTNKKEQQRPIIKNLRFTDGSLYMDTSGSFINTEKARLTVDDKETFPLNLDDTGVNFRVGHDKTSTPGGLKVNQAIPQGKDVSIIVENPDGSRSEAVTFRR
jgi:hypothetical protein